ncbi:MAG: ABC transporter ATP-binding protein [Clostridia bacterium]|nr:ABC transporter ATP-binding protein [Clostridia bacterium]
MKGFEAIGLRAGYDGQPVIDGLSFDMKEGTLMGVLGANGSGKTTLIKSICGILRHEGQCTLDGIRLENLTARQLAQKCSYIPQRSGISIDIPALDVVLMGFNPQLGLLEHPTRAMREQALNALAQAGLDGMAHTNYLHLSEGQKQLCILARTLVSQGRLLALDEPESALDFHFRYRMLSTIREWVKCGGRYAIVALHDPMLALNDCDELLLIKNGKSIGVLRPASDPAGRMEELLSELYGRVNIVACTDRTGRKHVVMLKEGEDKL